MPSYEKSAKFLYADFSRTLFPLETTKLVVQHSIDELGKYMTLILSTNNDFSFMPQQRVYASKPHMHLRRTVKLDPLAEFFAYDMCYRSRARLVPTASATRQSFGYGLSKGMPINQSESYKAFKDCILECSRTYAHFVKFDISAYFNSIYHHDLVNWFSNDQVCAADVAAFSQYFREINSGRSIDCLPQGIYPCKMLGSQFLEFVDCNLAVQSEFLARFMDDYYLFSDSEHTLRSDFITIQQLLGERGLSVNVSKTEFGACDSLRTKVDEDEVRAQLLELRREAVTASGTELADDDELEELSPEQLDYLRSMLADPNIEESDAELVLWLMRDDAQAVLEHLTSFISSFPNLMKPIYMFCRHVDDKQALGTALLEFLNGNTFLSEFQLFWLGRILDDYLVQATSRGPIYMHLYNHRNATPISKAKLLEIPYADYGIPDLREAHLRNGSSDWPAWAAAAGTRALAKRQRNHLLGYFGKCSYINSIVATGIKNA